MELIEVKKRKRNLKDFVDSKKMELLSLLVIANLVYLFVGSYLFTKFKITHSTFSLGLIPFFIVNIVVGLIANIKGKYKINSAHICGILIIILGCISTIFAVNRQVSLFGLPERNEGLFTIIYYFSFMYLSCFVDCEYKKKIILFMLILGITQCIYAILQIFGNEHVQKIVNFYPLKEKDKFHYELWATGFAGNPNFFGTQMLIFLTYTIGLLIDETKKRYMVLYAALCILFMYGLFISNTMSCVLGLVVCFVFCLVYAIKNKMYIKILIIAIMLVIGAGLAVYTGRTTLIKDVTKTGSEVSSMTKGDMNNTYGTKRIYIWKETMKIVPKHLVHGAGIDNFYYAFDGTALKYTDNKVVYDKAHNEYLQILICEGIICLIVYLVMYAIIALSGIKNSFKNKVILFILPVIGYLIQAFFNISVIEAAPIFFMALGFNIDMNKKEQKIINDKSSD